MKLTNRQVIVALQTLQSIPPTLPINPKLGFVLSRNTRKLHEAGSDYEAARERIFLSHGAEKQGQGWKANERNEVIFPDTETQIEAMVELEELLNLECDVDLRRVTEADLGKTDLPWNVFGLASFMFGDAEEE